MKKYILLIVLISFVSQLQAAAGKETLSVKNETTYTYTVTYTIANGQEFTVPLSPGVQKELDHNVNQITKMTYISDAIVKMTRTVDMGWVSQVVGQQYNHILIIIRRYPFGVVSYYGVGPNVVYYIAQGLEGLIQGIARFTAYMAPSR